MKPVLALLAAALVAQDPAPPARPESKRIESAIAKALGFLRTKMAAPNDPRCPMTGMNELLLWTLVHAGVPATDPDYRRLLALVEQGCPPTTYHMSLRAMALERIDRVKYRRQIADCAQALVDGQLANGQWGYVAGFLPTGPAAGRIEVRRRGLKPPAGAGDNSNSQFAALGLRACRDSGLDLPKETLADAAAWWRSCQQPFSGGRNPYGTPRSWAYRTFTAEVRGRRVPVPGYGSMTCGGISSLAILDGMMGKDPKKDPAILDGLAWMIANFTVKEHPGLAGGKVEGWSSSYLHYYLYSLERAAALAGVEKLGKRDWYAEGAAFLMDSQAGDGAWSSPSGAYQVQETCFAILFLRRATHRDVETPSSGAKSPAPAEQSR